jgi:hypothetical protein
VGRMGLFRTVGQTVWREKLLFQISIVKPTRCTSFSNLFYFTSGTLHVLDGLSVHHQESKTVHTDSADCLLAGTRCSISFPLASSQQNLYDIYLMLYVQS